MAVPSDTGKEIYKAEQGGKCGVLEKETGQGVVDLATEADYRRWSELAGCSASGSLVAYKGGSDGALAVGVSSASE